LQRGKDAPPEQNDKSSQHHHEAGEETVEGNVASGHGLVQAVEHGANLDQLIFFTPGSEHSIGTLESGVYGEGNLT
jgi:hypothetical protein